jgi:5-methylcytosine-specific restriction endonuclease McrA
MKSLSLARGRPIDLANTGPPAASELEQANAERTRLYHTQRWLRARGRFLSEHPLCAECERAGRIVAATVVDHRDGHRRADWRERFWDESTWQPLCRDCHNAKSGVELAEWTRAGGSRARDG